jgi:hypothetical protein
MAPAARTSGRLASTAIAGSACMFRTTRFGALPTLTSALLAPALSSAKAGAAPASASCATAAAMTPVLLMLVFIAGLLLTACQARIGITSRGDCPGLG